jgi:hypothetical protein
LSRRLPCRSDRSGLRCGQLDASPFPEQAIVTEQYLKRSWRALGRCNRSHRLYDAIHPRTPARLVTRRLQLICASEQSGKKICIVALVQAVSLPPVFVWADATPYLTAVRVDTAVRVHIAVHPVHHSARVVLAHTSHPVAVARTGSPITTNLTVLTPIPVFHTRLLGLLGAALRLREHSRVGCDHKPNGRDRGG